MKQCLALLLSLLWLASLSAQEYIRNGSLEGTVPQFDQVPQFWNKCRTENSPDIQPISTQQTPYEGSAFLGLAVYGSSPKNTRLAFAKETFGQRVDTLTPGFEYLITVSLSYDKNHASSEGEIEAHARLRVFIGDGCIDTNYIWQTPLIDHTDWKVYERNYIATCDNNYITFQATHGDLLQLDAGYILIDQISVTPINNESAVDTIRCGPIEVPIDTMHPMEETGGPCLLYIPNAFTPNHDGVNDVFAITTLCLLTEFQVEIFNRWGSKLFQSTEPEFSWDGDTQETGAYVSYITVRYLAENNEEKSEHHSNIIYLLR